MSEAQLRKDLTRGDRAKQLMEDPLVQEAINKIEQTLIEAWQNSHANDHEGRNNAYLMQRLLKNFKSEFERAIGTGKVAKKQLLNTNDPWIKNYLK